MSLVGRAARVVSVAIGLPAVQGRRDRWGEVTVFGGDNVFDEATLNPCKLVKDSEPRDDEKHGHGQCKCIVHWHYVYCYDRKDTVSPRKFNVSYVLEQCPEPYCARRADPSKVDPMKTSPCPTITGATVAPDSASACMCTNRFSNVFCGTESEKERIGGRYFEPADVLPICANPYCTTERGSLEETTATPSTITTIITTTTSMTSTPDIGTQWIDAGLIMEGNELLKCCEYTRGKAPPRVVNLLEQPWALKRERCDKKTKDCRCLFGNYWADHGHEQSSGKCHVQVKDLTAITDMLPLEIIELLHDLQEERQAASPFNYRLA